MIEIRPYEPDDRPAVRNICFVTGYMGDPVDHLWRDAASFADMFSVYYTDREPQSAQVAVAEDGRVIGYLLGCVDSQQAWGIESIMRRHVVRRGLLVRPGTAGFLWRSMGDLARDAMRRQMPPQPVHDARWPAHLHIDLLPEARGQGVGERLMRGWLDSLRGAGVAGCHLETWAENAAAIRFFEAQGFRIEGPQVNMPGMRAPDGSRHHSQLMVQSFGS